MQMSGKNAEYRLRKADARRFGFSSRGSTYFQPDGRVTIFGTTSEITERVRAEEAFRDANQFNTEIISRLAKGSLFTIGISVMWPGIVHGAPYRGLGRGCPGPERIGSLSTSVRNRCE